MKKEIATFIIIFTVTYLLSGCTEEKKILQKINSLENGLQMIPLLNNSFSMKMVYVKSKHRN